MFLAGAEGARYLLVSGKPLNEPVVQYGPFVMSRREEIDEAMRDYQDDTFVRDKAWINRKAVAGLGRLRPGCNKLSPGISAEAADNVYLCGCRKSRNQPSCDGPHTT